MHIVPENDLREILCEHPGKSWMLYISKPRHEKKLCEKLQSLGVPVYLPLLRKLYRYQSTTSVRFVPMFPNYVFACTATTERYAQSLGMSLRNVVFCEGPTAQQLYQELLAVRRFELLSLTHQVVVKPEIVPGTPVYIRSGLLQGSNAIVVRRKNKCTVIVNLQGLAYSAQAEINALEMELA